MGNYLKHARDFVFTWRYHSDHNTHLSLDGNMFGGYCGRMVSGVSSQSFFGMVFRSTFEPSTPIPGSTTKNNYKERKTRGWRSKARTILRDEGNEGKEVDWTDGRKVVVTFHSLIL